MRRQRPGVGRPGSGGQVVGRWPPSGLRPAEASSSGAIKLLTNPGGPVRFKKKSSSARNRIARVFLKEVVNRPRAMI